MNNMSERGTFAAVLATLVRQRLAATGGLRTSRTGLQGKVPVAERPSVRRGLDALLDIGILAMVGEDIGFSTQGRVFLAQALRSQGMSMGPGEDVRDPETLARLLAAIEEDERFDTDRTLDQARTLPGRLETFHTAREPRARSFNRWVIVVLVLAIAVVVYYVKR